MIAHIETLPEGTYSSEEMNTALSRLRNEWDDE